MIETKFAQSRKIFSMTCQVAVNIRAEREGVWSILTNAKDYGRWNSTVTNVEGRIREGERLILHIPGTTRTFTPRVSNVVANERMTWSDGLNAIFRGARTFQLRPCADGSTDFTMKERFSGLLLPLVRRWLPDFAPIFQKFAGDLKSEAEKMGRANKFRPDDARDLNQRLIS